MAKKIIYWAFTVCLLAAASCTRGTSHPEVAVMGDALITTVTVATPKLPARFAVEGSHDACAGAMEALASCAFAKTCDQDISMYLPATNRSQLIALEGKSGYSETAFDRYCVEACKVRDSRVDAVLFQQDVCGVHPMDPGASKQMDRRATESATATDPVVSAFSLRGQLEMGTKGVPLAEVVAAFGQPRKKSRTPYECGSAFNEGDIEEYDYPDFTLETDGRAAALRSVKIGNGNTIILSTGQALAQLSEEDFKRTYGSRATLFGDAYRTSLSPGGDLESAYDFHFTDGRLTQVDYWIAC